MRRVLITIAITIAIASFSGPAKGVVAQYGDLLISNPDICACGFTWTQFALLHDGHAIDMGLPRVSAPLIREMVVDRDGFIYGTDFDSFTLTKYTASMKPLSTYAYGAIGVTIDASGSIYGLAGDVTKYDRNGNLVARFTVPGGALTGDLEPDQCTLVYPDFKNMLRRFNLCTNAVVGDPGETLQVNSFPMLRVSATGDIFFSSVDGIRRMSRDGRIRVYALRSSSGAFALQGNTMWVQVDAGQVEHIDLSSGDVIAGPFSTGGTVFGLEVYGTTRAAAAAASLPAFSPLGVILLAVVLVVIAVRLHL